MYDLRQFRPTLYLVLILGISGFSIATQSIGLWLAAMGAIALNYWLVRTNRFIPLPRWIAGTITLLIAGVICYHFVSTDSAKINVLGLFLVLLQLVKLFEHRGNRDSAQLLVLSLLLMVGAVLINPALPSGILLIVYIVVALYCCLLFHLKMESDHARQLLPMPLDRLHTATLQQDRRYLARSMRRFTGLVWVVSMLAAVLVFVFFPRDSEAELLARLRFRPAQTLTGFSDEVSFQQVAQITQDDSEIAWVQVWHNDQLIRGEQVLYLRGLTLDLYTGDGNPIGPPWQWQRSPSGMSLRVASANVPVGLRTTGNNDRWVQKIQLWPTGTTTLFALPGICYFTSSRNMRVQYSLRDQTLQSNELLVDTLRYEAVSMNTLGDAPPSPTRRNGRWATTFTSRIDPQIAEYARRPDVSGSNDRGPLADQRNAATRVDPLDAQIAANIERHLRSEFTYTLDLTDVKRIAGRDPLVAFLYDFRRGHCEYFAGAMTAMCQSLGMSARVVVGFKCDEFNSMNDCYLVRQSHAHAWVEVLTQNGWKTFDPTSSRTTAVTTAQSGIWRQGQHVLSYLEYVWATAIVTYNSSAQQVITDYLWKVWDAIRQTIQAAAHNVHAWLSDRWWDLSSSVLLIIVGAILPLVLMIAIAYFTLEKWRMRRRAVRIGIRSLPGRRRVRLARQLGFYDALVRLLDEHNIIRPAHLTPWEFAESLVYLPSDTYDAIRRLTRIFYRVRFGEITLSTAHQRRLTRSLSQIHDSLADPFRKSRKDPG